MNAMKSTSSLVPTFGLLSLMLTVGVLAAFGGYTFGRNALKGTTQPVVNPILGNPTDGTGSVQQGNAFVQEKDILASVKQIQGLNKPAKDKPTATKTSAANTQPTPKPSPEAGTIALQSQDQGVSLEVRSLDRRNGDLILNVALKNNSSRAVQFFYTFLEITDDQGRPLTAVTQGLPTDLQPGVPEFTGTITIPEDTLAGVKQVSLSLTDYPNQNLRLQIPNIPVDN